MAASDRRIESLRASDFPNGYRLTFSSEQSGVVAKLSRNTVSYGECPLPNLDSRRRWTYETLPTATQQKVIQFFSSRGILFDPKESSMEALSKRVGSLSIATSSTAALGSDDDLQDLGSELTIFEREGPIEVEATTIPCVDASGKTKNIKGSELIEIIHERVLNTHEEAVVLATEYEKDIPGFVIDHPTVERGVIQIQGWKDWIMSLGGWKGMMPREEVQGYFAASDYPQFYPGLDRHRKFVGARVYDNPLLFPIENGRVHITKGFSIAEFDVTGFRRKVSGKWVKIPSGKTDLSYSQIGEAIRFIKNKFLLSDSDLAKLQLFAVCRRADIPEGIWKRTPEANQKEILQFLDYLNCLMFGIEASGLNAALIINLMTLDLIVDGVMDYQTAFKKNKDGGVYPYACFGNNKGSYSARERIILHRKARNRFCLGEPEKPDPLSLKEFRDLPSLSPVALKEAILIKMWLTFSKVIGSHMVYEEAVARIQAAIEDLEQYYLYPQASRDYVLEKFASKEKGA